MIGIIDFGGGNIHSVKKAFDYLGIESKVISSLSDFKGIDRLVFPGVGSYGHTIQTLSSLKMLYPIWNWIEEDRPFLGICLGFQLLFQASEESPGHKGLGFFQGECLRFTKEKVPQIGWNNIRLMNDHPLFSDIRSGDYFYFVHSYYARPEKEEIAWAQTFYGITYTSIAGKGNIIGVQFHPEKSGITGLQLLKNWVTKC
ncbi:MAG: imidazole glycerol phosphate synthase subunit HisH [Candidatus Aminicenantes bacterium]|nr:imidazole glycerol phosphate synthase subunit HisH [Candidatus Aminicenantes bacterium]